MPKQPLYPHVPKGRKSKPSSRPGLEDLRAKLVEKMSEEMGARDEYYELAKTASLLGLSDTNTELIRIGAAEHDHFLKLEEMERKLRSGGRYA